MRRCRNLPLRPALRRTTMLACIVLAVAAAPALGQFHVAPYVQHPTTDGMTVIWFSATDEAGTVTWAPLAEPADRSQRTSVPELAAALAYPDWEARTFFAGQAPPPPYRHRVRLEALLPASRYVYTVTQGATSFTDTFATAPTQDARRPVRLILFADSETEPESTGSPTAWADPSGESLDRRYPLDQTQGFANNLEVIWSRQPDLLGIAGDLVESGGEQRDWDEFWRHMTAVSGRNLAGRIPVLAAPGNHEYYEGPQLDRYEQPGSERAIARYLTYFDVPPIGASVATDAGRYYRVEYGPVTVISLDVSNGQPHQSGGDTNFYLLGDGEEGGGHSPGFGPGTRQYAWLEQQLRAAQISSAFTFVMFHHVPYSVGPHGWPAGPSGTGTDPQSGVPVRALVPLFLATGVDAVFAGHDEIWERSEVEGEEVLPDGRRRPHVLQVLDLGVGGDGLRGPVDGLTNPNQRFLVHADAPEVWRDGVLVEGGKHYGHLEVDVLPLGDAAWQAVLKPVHVFPLWAADGNGYAGYERRLYDDTVVLTAPGPATAVGQQAGLATNGTAWQAPYPNPFNATVLLRYRLGQRDAVRVYVFDALGRRVRRLVDSAREAGDHSVEWNGTDDTGNPVASGVYLVQLQAGSVHDSVEVVLAR